MNKEEQYHLIDKIDYQSNKIATKIHMISIGVVIIMITIGLFIDDLFQIDGLLKFFVLVCGTFVYLALHEITHGVFMNCFSSFKTIYGVNKIYLYTKNNGYFTKRQFILIALSPIVIWGIFYMALLFFIPSDWFWVIYFWQICNISGSIGDIVNVCYVMKYQNDIFIVDDGCDIRVYK